MKAKLRKKLIAYHNHNLVNSHLQASLDLSPHIFLSYLQIFIKKLIIGSNFFQNLKIKT